MLKDKVKSLCKLKGVTIMKLENDLELGSGTIAKWDKATPKVDTILKVATYFNVSVDYLLGRTEPPTDEEIKAVFPNGRMDFQLFGDKGQAVNQKYIDRALELFAQMSDEEKEKAIHQIEMVLAYSKMKKE